MAIQRDIGDTSVAQQIQVQLTDDLDGSEATHTITFGWLGANYEIDLNDKNHAAFEKAIAKYLSAARKAGGQSSGKASKKAQPRVDLAAARAWARDHGYTVAHRGRVSGEIIEAFKTQRA
jgi:hypothetical protein